jgi:hypothetical protein
MFWANVISLGLFIPIIFIPSAFFIWIWDIELLINGFGIFVSRPLIFLAGFFGLIILHELIHGLTWQWISGINRDEIEYGFKWKILTPYAHVKIPIELQSYRWGAAMPGILLGLLPTILGLALGNGLIFLIGLIMTAAAGGDILILFLLRNDSSPAFVEDHTDNAGCYVLVENERLAFGRSNHS